MGHSTALALGVCPTYVGMNRALHFGGVIHRRMPHVGGDEPNGHFHTRLE